MRDHVAALRASSVWSRYGRRQHWALSDISFAVPQGSITALVGPNGAGKSTLIKSWVGLERPTKGHVEVLGVDPARDRAAAVNLVGHVSQSLGLYRSLSLHDTLRLAWTLRPNFGVDSAAERLRDLGIPLDTHVGRLSGGQQAQVALALALGSHAPVLLLDEPLASLDPLARHEFMRILVADARARGATVLISSHILSDIAFAVDRIVMIRSGRLAIDDDISRLLHGHRLTAGDPSGDKEIVASFHRPGGEKVSLLRTSDPMLEAPTLEELVMGYLAATATHPGVMR
jgi:ABC-2 type transport system ATP-binding protein